MVYALLHGTVGLAIRNDTVPICITDICFNTRVCSFDEYVIDYSSLKILYRAAEQKENSNQRLTCMCSVLHSASTSLMLHSNFYMCMVETQNSDSIVTRSTQMHLPNRI